MKQIKILIIMTLFFLNREKLVKINKILSKKEKTKKKGIIENTQKNGFFLY
jgi:hypothetical protein